MISQAFHIILIFVTLGVFVLAYVANLNKLVRYKQFYFPILALLIGISALYIFQNAYVPVKLYIISLLAEYLDDVIIQKIDIAFDFIFGLIFVATFVVLKWMYRFSLAKLKNRFGPAYYLCHIEYIPYLKNEWYFSRLFFRYLSFISIALFILSYIAFRYALDFFPLFTAFSLLIILEILYYLSGEVKTGFEKDNISGIDSISKITAKYNMLWEEYQVVWQNYFSVAWFFNGLPNYRDRVEKVEHPVLQNLMQKGDFITTKDLQIFNLIEDRKDILIDTTLYDWPASLISASLYNMITKGKNVLILVQTGVHIPFSKTALRVEEWIHQSLCKITGLDYFARPIVFDPAYAVPFTSNIIICSASDILKTEKYRESWFDDLQTLLLFNAANMFESEFVKTTTLTNILKHKNRDLQIIAISSEYREGLEAGVRSMIAFNSTLTEHRYPFETPVKNFILLWNEENEEIYQSKVTRGHVEKYLGVATVLSLLAWRNNMKNIRLMGMENLPAYEYLEELENHKTSLRIDQHLLKGTAHSEINDTRLPFLEKRWESAALFCRDEKYNLPGSLKKWNSFVEKNSLLCIISPPYLLRDYFSANLHYFYDTPKFSLAPLTSETRFNAAYFLLHQMLAFELKESEITEIIKRYCREIKIISVIDTLSELFIAVFGINNLLKYLKIRITHEFTTEEACFIPLTLYSFHLSILDVTGLSFQKSVAIKDRSGNTLRTIQYDFLYQQYLENQIITFNGKTYKVEGFNATNSILNVSFTSPQPHLRFRHSKKVKGDNPLTSSFSSQHFEIKEKYTLRLLETGFVVQTKGYFYFSHEINLSRKTAFVPLRNVPERHYHSGRILKISLNSSFDQFSDNLLKTFMVLLDEVLITLFPETWQFLICGIPSTTVGDEDTHFRDYFAHIEFEKGYNESQSILLIEDAHQDLGLLPAIASKFEYILTLMDDYLEWLTNPQVKEGERKGYLRGPEIFRASEVNRQAYLQYGFDTMPSFLQPGLLKEYLSHLLDNHNHLTSERHNYYAGEKTNLNPEDTGHLCDFCASPIQGSELEVLDDGRERCSACSREAINDIAELTKVLEEAKSYFNQLFKQKVPKGISVEFTNAEKIHNELGKVFVPTSGYDARAVGLAWEKTIMIENGSPYANTLSTVVHELTHIWQNENLDTVAMREAAGLLFIEGHAVWASVKVLEFKNIAEEYRNHYENRQDEYGEGYRLIKEMLERQKMNNAFILMKNMFSK